ncbi:DNA replication protein DnaD [Heyndrickxia shackletonii]|uniref:DNA replication protein DnaD n=2 Tax=Heyndrickxia shackletonii TaxID=157838 RepID=A0A0Q3WYB1_9BACI|nr:DnaD domain protein [Heyndrickxia shackletonii]KQL54181.1 DNA replication protein DnaD [Heyndrickxia shackletonii]
MAKYRMVRTDFWKSPIVLEQMTPKDRYFYLYLLTNPHTTQIGIYRITKKQMAFDLGFSIESVHSLMERFEGHHQLIRYNPKTRELAIKNWGKENLQKGGKPVMDCIISELKEVEDHLLIQYVAESIHKEEIRRLYEAFYHQKGMLIDEEKDPCQELDETMSPRYATDVQEEEAEKDLFIELDDTFSTRFTIRGQKEKQKEKEKQKQQQDLYPSIENNPDIVSPSQSHQKTDDVKEIIEFWDANGFGFTNINAKQQLLSWLDDSRFLQPKEMIIKAMNIACANNKRRLSYITGILKNWENESLLTVEEVDSYDEIQKQSKASTVSFPAGRAIPSEFVFDPTAGEVE